MLNSISLEHKLWQLWLGVVFLIKQDTNALENSNTYWMLSNGEPITLSSVMSQTMNIMPRFATPKSYLNRWYLKYVYIEISYLNLICLFHLFRLEMVLRIIRHGQDQKIWPAPDHLTRSIATDLDPMLLPRLLHHLLLHQSCSREKMMIILPSCWITLKECTSLPMSAEENIPTRFMMPASSTSNPFYY